MQILLLQELVIYEANQHLSYIGFRRARNPPRSEEHCGGLQALAAGQLADAENDPVLLRARKSRKSVKQPIPDGKDGAEIGVRLLIRDGVVDEVQVKRDHHWLQELLQPFR